MRSTYAIEPPLDRPPRQRVADADEAVVVEEAEQVVDREVADPVGAVDQTAEVIGTRKWLRKPGPNAAIVEVVAAASPGRRGAVEDPPRASR